MIYWIRDREAGNKIDKFATYIEAANALEEYEAADEKESTYTPNFYEVYEDRHNWYAVLAYSGDDWGTGSFDFDEAVEMAKEYGYEEIAEIDGKYDEDGNATADPICIKAYFAGEDF